MHEGDQPPFLTVYNRAYFMAWANRFKSLSTGLRVEFSWLDDLLGYFVAHIHVLTTSPHTIIHGEYYPRNILMKAGDIYPVDWESTAIGPGEIDLASLIEGWEEADAASATEAYCLARWPLGNDSPELFAKKLLLARIYFYLWWWPDRIDADEWKGSYAREQALQLARDAGIC
jgi:thiamine kinase-like enzyme